jgi:multiple sugar transport system substrate-binding protein
MRALLTATCAAAVILTAGAGLQAQQDKLVIAGRDGGYANALEMAVESFKQANPNVAVERLALPYGGLYEKATIAMREQSGAYDVVMLDDTWAVEFMSNGWLADLDELGGGLDADFVGPAVDVARYPVGSGPLYALPFVGNVELFAYNSEILKAHDLSAPQNWDDVVEIAKQVDADGGDTAGVVFRGQKANPIVTGFLPILWAHGGRVVTGDGKAGLTSDGALAALETFLELKRHAPEGVINYNSSEVRDALMTGRTAMTIELWPSWAPDLDNPEKSQVVGDIEIMAAPGQIEGPAPMLGSWLVAVPQDSDNKQMARKFIDHLTSAKMQKRLALEVGTPPTRASVYEDDQVVDKYRWYPAQLAALRNAQPRPRITEWSRVETILGDYLQLAMIGEMAPKAALAEANARIARTLN